MNIRLSILFLFCLLSAAKSQPVFQAFDRFNSPLPDNTCRTIAVDAQGRKWFGTEYGIAVYDDVNWTVYTSLNSGLTDNSIKHITFDAQQRAWISTQNGGVCVFDGTTWTSYTTANSDISVDYVRSTTIDRFGHAWICTNLGLNYFDGATWRIFDMSNSSLPVDNIAVIAIENDSTRWIGTVNGGFVKMVDTAFTVYNLYLSNFPDNTITGVVIDTSGIKWGACPAGGLSRFFNGAVFAYNQVSSNIPTSSLTSLAFDSLQNLYIGSFDKGLIKKSGNSFTYWDTQNSAMPDDLVYAVAVERNGVIWCGTETHGVVRFDETGLSAVSEAVQSGENALSIYPNPVSNRLHIQRGEISPVFVEVIDRLGKTVWESDIYTENTSLDVSSLPAGVYLLKSTSTSKTDIVRFIVSH
ncbi:MAG: T9SS type A sorting domain-containing protein [Bacteroidota bacterium]